VQRKTSPRSYTNTNIAQTLPCKRVQWQVCRCWKRLLSIFVDTHWTGWRPFGFLYLRWWSWKSIDICKIPLGGRPPRRDFNRLLRENSGCEICCGYPPTWLLQQNRHLPPTIDTDFRQISVTPIVSKILESFSHSWLLRSMSELIYISSNSGHLKVLVAP
jgi:hypothetical protein